MVAHLLHAAVPSRVHASVHGKTGENAAGGLFAGELSGLTSLLEASAPDLTAWGGAVFEHPVPKGETGDNPTETPDTEAAPSPDTPIPPAVTSMLAAVMPSVETELPAKIGVPFEKNSAKPSNGRATPNKGPNSKATTGTASTSKAVDHNAQQPEPGHPTFIPAQVPQDQRPMWDNPRPQTLAAGGPSFITTQAQLAAWENAGPQNAKPTDPSFIDKPGDSSAAKTTNPAEEAQEGPTFITTSREIAGWKPTFEKQAVAGDSAKAGEQRSAVETGPPTVAVEVVANSDSNSRISGTDGPAVSAASTGIHVSQPLSLEAFSREFIAKRPEATSFLRSVKTPQAVAVRRSEKQTNGGAARSEVRVDQGLKSEGEDDGAMADRDAESAPLPLVQHGDEQGNLIGVNSDDLKVGGPATQTTTNGEIAFAARIQANSQIPSSASVQSPAQAQQSRHAAPIRVTHDPRPEQTDATTQESALKMSGEVERKVAPLKVETLQNPQPMPYTLNPREIGNASSSTAQTVHSTAHVELPPTEAEHPTSTTTLKEVSFHVAQANEKIEVRIIQQAGEVRVAVRAGDTDMVHGLRQNLSELSNKLQQSGYSAETWRPMGSAEAMGTGNDSHKGSGDPNQGQSQSQSQSGGSQQDHNQQNQNRFNRPRWVEEMESTQNLEGKSTGVTNGFGN